MNAVDLKLDTREKKPKVVNVALLTGVVLVLLVLLQLFGRREDYLPEGILMTLYFLAVTALLIRAFFLQMQYNLYSYNTIIYFGFALFTLFIAVSYLRLVLMMCANPQYTAMGLVANLLSSGSSYVLLTTPFLLVFSLAMIVSNVSLIRHEGFRPVNALGILLAFLLMGGVALIFLLNFYASGSRTEVMLHDLGVNVLTAGYLYFECMLLGTMAADAIAARSEPEKDRDYIIVLGCGIRSDGTPTPLLRGRLDRALDFARALETQTGKMPVLVLSGGQGADEVISEARCMHDYLKTRGVPESGMLLEDRSTDTAENMRFSRELIFERNPDAKIAFSTTNYHVFRAGLKARRVKMRAIGMGCRSRWYFWPNAAVREFVGLLTEHRGKQALILAGLLIAYAAMTLFYYMHFA